MEDWVDIVERIRSGDQSGVKELYDVFSRGIRYHLRRHLGSHDLDDHVHDCFLVVIQAINKGDLHEPKHLMGFVRTIVSRKLAGFIGHRMESRKQIEADSSKFIPDGRLDPELTAISKQNKEMIAKLLRAIPPRDKDILTRFYLYEESPEQICREMKLTATQFRLMKSRARAKFGELGKQRLTMNTLLRRFKLRNCEAESTKS